MTKLDRILLTIAIYCVWLKIVLLLNDVSFGTLQNLLSACMGFCLGYFVFNNEQNN